MKRLAELEDDRGASEALGVDTGSAPLSLSFPLCFAPPSLAFFSFSSLLLSLGVVDIDIEDRVGFLTGLAGGKEAGALPEKLNFLSNVLNVPGLGDVDGGGMGFDGSGRDGCEVHDGTDASDEDRGRSDDDGEEYDLATADAEDDPGRDDFDRKCDIEPEIDILLFRADLMLELTLETDAGVETNNGSSILSIPNCFPTTLPKVDKAGEKYSPDPAAELEIELGLSTLGGDDVEGTHEEVGDERGEAATVNDRPLPGTFSFPLTLAPSSPGPVLSAARFLGGTGSDGSSYSGERAILHSNPPRLALRPGLGIGVGTLMLPLLISRSFIRGKGEVALRPGSSRYKPTLEGRPMERPLIRDGPPLSALLPGEEEDPLPFAFPPPLCIRRVKMLSPSFRRVPCPLSLLVITIEGVLP